MSKRFQRGLVVGKFSPLHRGHELVIRRAFELCHEVVLINYSNPELPGCDAVRREKWLADLFPDTRRLVATNARLREWLPESAPAVTLPPNEASDFIQRRFTGLLCLKVLGVSVDAVFTSEDYGDGFAAELTRYFREHNRSTPAVTHVMVDRHREVAPISGSMIRADVHEHRQWLSPKVYASFVERVCILGGESSGKSTLARELARHFGTKHVAEYGRELWEAKGGALEFEDLLHIAERQVADEETAALQARKFLFCDTSPLTTLFYCEHLFQRADPKLEELANRPYDHVVLCATDFAFVQDGTRQDTVFRARQHEWYQKELTLRGVSYTEITGSVEERIAQIGKVLNNSAKQSEARGYRP